MPSTSNEYLVAYRGITMSLRTRINGDEETGKEITVGVADAKNRVPTGIDGMVMDMCTGGYRYRCGRESMVLWTCAQGVTVVIADAKNRVPTGS